MNAFDSVADCVSGFVTWTLWAPEPPGVTAVSEVDETNVTDAAAVAPMRTVAPATNPVPLIVTIPGMTLAEGGELADLAPTILQFLGIDAPVQMTGKPLVNPP